ncbi:MAG: aminomethyl-transferring glycine dehydrogenase subunit GcvPA [Proteobacteria bacterium]|nr:aminomethyl-transferring glycine dehydrogenase subunit GcvPA [Pseudomonadota bacterium]
MRHLPHTSEEIAAMLSRAGAKDLDTLFKAIPKGLRCDAGLAIPEGMAEQDLWKDLNAVAMQNRTMSCSSSFLGGGAYRHYVPAAVSELAGRSEFVTPYTPYQPEVSQGTLQAIFEYQSQICRIFGMDVSNGSHYSGATAAADAALMARRISKGRKKVLLPENMHPEYRHVVETVIADEKDVGNIPASAGHIDRAALSSMISDEVAAVFVQYPNFFGIVEDLRDVAQAAHEARALMVAVVPEPIALGILNPPGSFGADIAVGEGLSLGLPVSFGGPTLGIFTARRELVRDMPGRICGKTVDAGGRPGYVLTLSTREQHIRRERATSNICSNQALCATTAAIYMSMLGKEGMRELASINAAKADYAKKRLASVAGVEIPFEAPTFNEFVYETARPAADVLDALLADGIMGGIDLGKWMPDMDRRVLVCATELNTKQEIDGYADALAAALR